MESDEAVPATTERSKPLATVFVVLVIVMLSLGVGMALKKTPTAKPDPSRTAALIAEISSSAEVAELTRVGILHKVQVADWGVAVVVGRNFGQLTFDQKSTAIGMVARVVGPSRGGDHFLLYDPMDNSKLGAWRGAKGLDLDRRR